MVVEWSVDRSASYQEDCLLKVNHMGETKIEWTNKTWNPVRGCSVVSEGCRNCYAMTFAARFAKEGEPFEGLAYRNSSGAHWAGKVRLIENHLNDPLRWRRPAMVFVNSMSDLFHESIPDGWIDCIFAVMAQARHHVFQILTKRPERMRDYMLRLQAVADEHAPKTVEKRFTPTQVLNLRMLAGSIRPGGIFGTSFDAPWPLPNVHLGTSVEDQKTADERIPLLLQTPAAVRWISAEPLLGPVELGAAVGRKHGSEYHDKYGPCTCAREARLDWVVVGGESGPKARDMDIAWALSIVAQCKAAGVPVFMKQMGARPIFHTIIRDEQKLPTRVEGGRFNFKDKKGGDINEWPEDLRVREFPRVTA